MCRLTIDTSRKNLLMSPDLENTLAPALAVQNISHPYRVYKCALSNTTTVSRCQYGEWQLNKEYFLGQNVKVVLYLFNTGQTYNIRIIDMNEAEIDRIASTFAYFFVIFLGALAVIAGLIVVRPLCLIGCVYLGWYEQ